ncbi:hypothetical protein FPANT_4041 [Fusarium pseudoanthophilum]|uniref:Uncharacterized protein n=1 Tax=Fusarium pseudoanthophilum TaxID=48495 RepID=A0A8H5PJD3_9HYPO|nr:hypothetical protein FPANT_4041 [Fusarium pseudoanthophilum]
MDPFDNLPAELRLSILIHTRSKWSVSSLTRASPAMLRQYHTHERYIARSLIAADFDDEMVQDAMAILFIQNSCKSSMRKHILDWSKHRLPNPLKDYNNPQFSQLFDQLNTLHSRVFFFIEDYVTKATSSYPSRDYLCLPRTPESKLPTTEGHLWFNGQKIAARFNASNLKDTEIHRFLKAFLLFELNCRVKTSLAATQSRLPQRELDTAEHEAIKCVNTYICSLYCAMFAQCSNAWLPDASASLQTGLLFPDTFFINPEIYASDMGQLELVRAGYVIKDENKVEGSFARFGLGPLIEFLGHDMSDVRDKQALKERLRTWYIQKYEYPYKSGILCSTESVTSRASPVYSQLFYEVDTELQRNIYRQRAWVFFDDRRLYPKRSTGRPNFPTQSFLDKQPSKQAWVEGWFDNPSRARTLRRSQRWHDELCGWLRF